MPKTGKLNRKKRQSKINYNNAKKWEKNKQIKLKRSQKRKEEIDRLREKRIELYKQNKLREPMDYKKRQALYRNGVKEFIKSKEEKEFCKLRKYCMRKSINIEDLKDN